MKPFRAAFLIPCILASACLAYPQAAEPHACTGAHKGENNDSINAAIITEDLINRAMRKTSTTDYTPLGLSIYNTPAGQGGFRGYQPGLDNPNPDCLENNGEDIYDFLVQSIVIDEQGNPTTQTPLDIPADRPDLLRNIRPGDKLPYVGSNYPLSTDPDLPAGQDPQRQHRYAIPFTMNGTADGREYRIVTGLRDFSPSTKIGEAEYNTRGARDGVSMIGIFPDYASYMGSFNVGNNSYSYSYGPGIIANAASNPSGPTLPGVERFARASYPNPVPVMDSMWYACILMKSEAVIEERAADTAEYRSNFVVPQFQAGKRLMYRYGTRDKPTRPLDTIVVLAGMNNPNSRGTAPQTKNISSGCERIYLTKEFGYCTRWELWASEKDKLDGNEGEGGEGGEDNEDENPSEGNESDIIRRAKLWYANDSGGMPADFGGNYTEHFQVGPMQEYRLEDENGNLIEGYYWHTQTIIDPDLPEGHPEKVETLKWYLVGVHDFTNLQPQTEYQEEPYWDPFAWAPPAVFNPYFFKSFSIGSKVAWTGSQSADLSDPDNWERPPLPDDTLDIHTSTPYASLIANTTSSHRGMELAYEPGTRISPVRANLTVTDSTLALPGYLIAAEGNYTETVITLDNSTLDTTHAFFAVKRYAKTDLSLVNSTLNAGSQVEFARAGDITLRASNLTLDTAHLRIANQTNSAGNITLDKTTIKASRQITLGGNGVFTLGASDTHILGNLIHIISGNNRLTRGDASFIRSSISADRHIHIAAKIPAAATLSFDNSSLYAYENLHVAQDGAANVILSNRTQADGRLYVHLATNGTLGLSLADHSTLNAIREIYIAQNTGGSANITLDNHSTISTRNMIFAENGTLNLGLSRNSSIVSGNYLSLAASPSSTASILLDDSTITVTNNLILGQGRLDITLRPPLASPQQKPALITAKTLDIQGSPSIILDCAHYSTNLPALGPLAVDLIRTSTSTDNTQNLTLTPANYQPDTHQVDFRWNANHTLLQAVITDLRPPYNNEDELLLYALTDKLVQTNTGNLVADPPASLDHLPQVRIDSDNTLSITFLPLRENLVYEVQQSSDLETWTSIETIQGNTSLTEPLTIKTDSLANEEESSFLRLKIIAR